MKHLISVIIVFILALICLESCRKKTDTRCGNIPTYHYLTAEDKKLTPYHGSDTVVFINDQNDTAVCISNSKVDSFLVSVQPTYIDGCDPVLDYWEIYCYSFQSHSKAKLNFSVNVMTTEGGVPDVLRINIQSYSFASVFYYIKDQFYSNYSIKGEIKNAGLLYEDSTIATLLYNHHEGVIQFKSQKEKWTKIK